MWDKESGAEKKDRLGKKKAGIVKKTRPETKPSYIAPKGSDPTNQHDPFYEKSPLYSWDPILKTFVVTKKSIIQAKPKVKTPDPTSIKDVIFKPTKPWKLAGSSVQQTDKHKDDGVDKQSRKQVVQQEKYVSKMLASKSKPAVKPPPAVALPRTIDKPVTDIIQPIPQPQPKPTQVLSKLQQVTHKQTKSKFDAYIEDQHGNRKDISQFAHDKFGNVVLHDDKELHKEFHIPAAYNVVRGGDHNIHMGYHAERYTPKFAQITPKINSSHAQPTFAKPVTPQEPKAESVQMPKG